MTQEDKELLLNDICGRLNHNVKLKYRCNHIHSLNGITKTGLIVIVDTNTIDITTTDVTNVKPYLFPISSITEEQISQLEFWTFIKEYHKITDFYHENHIDFRGLIEKGFAIDATGLNIY